jgi:large subunit ribosomal protein L14e
LAKGLARQKVRANLTDFDRFKLMRLKQARNRIVKAELGKMSRKK